MTEREVRLVVALTRCTLQPGSWDKRFVSSLEGRTRPLTEKQVEHLERIRVRYRRQLRAVAPDLVADLPAKPPRTHDPSREDLEKLAAWNRGDPLPGKR